MSCTASIEDQFCATSSEKTILSIRYATDGFSFCIHDEEGKLVASRHLPFKADSPLTLLSLIHERTATEPWLSLSYKQVYISAGDRNYFLLPESCNQAEQLPLFAPLHMESDPDDHFFSHIIPEQQIAVISVLPEPLHAFFQQRYPGFIFTNCAVPFLKRTLASHNPEAKELFLDIREEFCYITLLAKGCLLFFNTFLYQSETDIVYYIFNTLKNMEVNSEETSLTISGQYGDNDKLKKLLSQYIAPLSFSDSPITDLLNLHLCGL